MKNLQQALILRERGVSAHESAVISEWSPQQIAQNLRAYDNSPFPNRCIRCKKQSAVKGYCMPHYRVYLRLTKTPVKCPRCEGKKEEEAKMCEWCLQDTVKKVLLEDVKGKNRSPITRNEV